MKAKGLREIAIVEATKGWAVLLLGFGLLGLLHSGVESSADSILIHLHIEPNRRFSHAFLNAASRMTDAHSWGVAAAALAYSCVHLTEAWGLWRSRAWAQWFAVLSGATYLPWEFLAWVDHPNRLHAPLFLGNRGILFYILLIRIKHRPERT